MKKLFLSAVLIASSTSIFADQICDGVLQDNVIETDLKVTDNCKLIKTKVTGNIILMPNSSITLVNSEISGEIEAKSPFNQLTATNTTLRSGLNLHSGRHIRLVGNRIQGNTTLTQNQGHIFIQNNHIQGHLKCESNLIKPQGGQNYVQGDKEHQCLSL